MPLSSFNHYAYGTVFDWIFGVCAGIKPLPDGAGYKHISIKPHTDKRLSFLKAGIETKYGKLSSYWYYKGDHICFELEIPDGAIAEIFLPDGTHNTVYGGKYLYTVKNT